MLKGLHQLPRFFRSWAFFEKWISQANSIKKYWSTYGGLKALLTSPYLHISAVTTLICVLFWSTNEKAEYAVKASELAVSILPNLLGFTVGALAIVLAFSSADIFKVIAEDGDPKSFFITLTANLVHFISIQVVALIVGILARIIDNRILDITSLFFLIYAVLVTFSAALQLFQTAVIYNTKAGIDK